MPLRTYQHKNVLSFVPSLLAIAVSNAAIAQTEDPHLDEVVITAHPLSAEGLAQAAHILEGRDLEQALGNSLGETLQNVPGVHPSGFGNAVSRPIIRGLSGPRVKITEDRIDSLDVSVSSPDHMTSIEPFIARGIEVLKGSSTLIYGSGAIGGVVDVHTGRILHEVPEDIEGDLEVRATDNADQRVAAGRVDGGSGNFAFHLDAFYRDADPYEIPGFAESARYRALEEHGEHEDHEEPGEHDEDGHGEEEEAFGVLPGSQLKARGGAIGMSYVSDRGFAGLAVSRYESEYGLPGHSHHHEEGHEDADHDEAEHEEHGEELPPILDMEQTRVDLEAGIYAPLAGIESINLRVGINDYEHLEIEGDEAGTRFATEAWESRLEVNHEAIMGFAGSAGLQVSDREFSIIGDEAFVQPVDTQTVGLFWVAEKRIGDTELETGVRYEHVGHDPSAARSRSFNLVSASLGLIQPLSDSWTFSGQLDYANRAPVAEELFSNGPHLATQTFELGDENLIEETAKNISVGLSYEKDSVRIGLNAYLTKFDDFIYQQNTGLEEDELPVTQWAQQNATFLGFEADASWQAAQWDGGALTLGAGFDFVDATLDEGNEPNLPRIPPSRWRVGAEATWGQLRGAVTWLQVADQDDVSENELVTDGYDDVRVNLVYAIQLGASQGEIFLNGRNLTDDEQRQHTSFIGQFAPQPGRTLEAGFRLHL